MKSVSNRPVAEIQQDIERSIDYFQSELDAYTDEQFRRKPDEDSWSIGQLYTHLFDAGIFFFLKKINKCLENEENAEEILSENGFSLFQNQRFPASKIQGPPKSAYDPQPADSIDGAREQMEKLRITWREVAERLEKSDSRGRRRHFIFGYMNAWEWYEVLHLHFNHHLKQKDRIDSFLGVKASGS